MESYPHQDSNEELVLIRCSFPRLEPESFMTATLEVPKSKVPPGVEIIRSKNDEQSPDATVAGSPIQ